MLFHNLGTLCHHSDLHNEHLDLSWQESTAIKNGNQSILALVALEMVYLFAWGKLGLRDFTDDLFLGHSLLDWKEITRSLRRHFEMRIPFYVALSAIPMFVWGLHFLQLQRLHFPARCFHRSGLHILSGPKCFRDPHMVHHLSWNDMGQLFGHSPSFFTSAYRMANVLLFIFYDHKETSTFAPARHRSHFGESKGNTSFLVGFQTYKRRCPKPKKRHIIVSTRVTTRMLKL